MQLDPNFEPSSLIRDAASDSFGPAEHLPSDLVLAVSGGSDSTALLRLAHWWAGQAGKRVIALTVDHGLRPESAAEAQQVAEWCAQLGVEHHTLKWDYSGNGNLSAAAREGRYRLMADFCTLRGISTLYTGHTKDDQAETVLMRLARGSGVDGLAAMARETLLWGITLVRPFIRNQTRENLRTILKEFDQTWIEDPTNDDPGYDRVKAREILVALQPLGLTRERLVSTAHMLGLAREVLDREASLLVHRSVRFNPLGYATLDPNGLLLARDTALRGLAKVLGAVGGAPYRPRLEALDDLLDWVLAFPREGGRTLHGCQLKPFHGTLAILREPARCAPKTQAGVSSGTWDGRFSVDIAAHPNPSDLSVGALGEAGLQQIPKDYDGFSEAWRAAPREARLTTPGLWDGDTLLSAPLAPWVRDPTGPMFTVQTVWPE